MRWFYNRNLGCLESFQILDAFTILLKHGAKAVRRLEKMSSTNHVVDWNWDFSSAEKVVIFTSHFLSDAHRHILHCLRIHQCIQYCSIYTSVSEIAHAACPDTPLGPDAFQEYRSLLLQDYKDHVKKSLRFSKGAESEDFSKSGVDANLSDVDFGPGWHHEDEQLVISVQHFPMIFCPFSSHVFVLPSNSSIAAACLSTNSDNDLSSRLPPITSGTPIDSEDVSSGGVLTAHFLHHLASKMDLKLEIFSLGDLSSAVGNLMMEMSSLYNMGRRRCSAGLLLIDRTFDLVTPCCHGDTLADRLFSSPLRSSDLSNPNQRPIVSLSIPLSNLLPCCDSKADEHCFYRSIKSFISGWNNYSPPTTHLQDPITLDNSVKEQLSDTQLTVGTFPCNQTPVLCSVLSSRTKGGISLIEKCLREALHHEELTVRATAHQGITSGDNLSPMIHALSRNDLSLIRNKEIVQLAAAAMAALDERYSLRWEAFMQAEKMLRLSAVHDTSQSLISQVTEMVTRSASLGPFSLEDALLLVVVAYLLAGENFPTSGSTGPFPWQEEQALKQAITDTVTELRHPKNLKFLYGLSDTADSRKACVDQSNDSKVDDFEIHWDAWESDDDCDGEDGDRCYDELQVRLELRYRVDNLFRYLHKLSSVHLPFKEGLRSSDCKGFLYRVLMKILSGQDIPGLRYHSSAMERLFKTGFGRFGLGQGKHVLGVEKTIIVFVIGGINGVEIAEAQEAVSESGRTDVELVLGGTNFLTPADMFDAFLGRHSYT